MKPLLKPLDFEGVTLDSGPMRGQLDLVREYSLRIPNDDLLRGFRERAGMEAPGQALGGWYDADFFNLFGHVLSGLARLYAATGDEACRAKLGALIDGWAECIGPDGFFFYTEKPNAPHYFYDKMLGGLLDAHLCAGHPRALELMAQITDWAEKNLGGGSGEPHTGVGWDLEWYTLSENLYRAFLATGDERYRDFGKRWEYRAYWDCYAQNVSIFDGRPDGARVDSYHAYSHVNTLGGLGAGYLATGDVWYLSALRNAYDSLMDTQVYATGGYGPNEQLLRRDELVGRLTTSHDSFEEQCGSWAASKMARYLISGTGEARYGDWVERLALNGIGADIPMSADGRVHYFADYNLGGGRKRLCASPWTCCAGSRPLAVADYVDQIYYRDEAGLYVNLYVPSTATLDIGGVKVTAVQRTRFPADDTTAITLGMATPARFTVGFRVPGWLSAPMEVRVNGRPARSRSVDGWLMVERAWGDGDRIRVRTPMGLWSSSFDPGAPYPAAVLFGPTVLAFRAEDPQPLTQMDLNQLNTELEPVAGEALTWRLRRSPGVLARPLSAYEEGEPYFVYVAPRMPLWIPSSELRYEGEWPVSFDVTRAAPNIGESVWTTFRGTGITWNGGRYDDAGIGIISIDGEEVARVDQYGPGRGIPFTWESPQLAPGEHTIRITVAGERNPDSQGHYINVSGLAVER